MATQTIIEYVRRDNVLYKVEHTMIETIVDERVEKITAIDKEIADLQARIAELQKEKTDLGGAPKP